METWLHSQLLRISSKEETEDPNGPKAIKQDATENENNLETQVMKDHDATDSKKTCDDDTDSKDDESDFWDGKRNCTFDKTPYKNILKKMNVM